MTMTLCDSLTIQPARDMMDRGRFAHHHTWRSDTGWTVEYWRGIEGNGACIRAYDDLGRNMWITHRKHPGDALQWLRGAGYPVPGL